MACEAEQGPASIFQMHKKTHFTRPTHPTRFYIHTGCAEQPRSGLAVEMPSSHTCINTHTSTSAQTRTRAEQPRSGQAGARPSNAWVLHCWHCECTPMPRRRTSRCVAFGYRQMCGLHGLLNSCLYPPPSHTHTRTGSTQTHMRALPPDPIHPEVLVAHAFHIMS